MYCVMGRAGMYGLLLDHPQGFTVILYNNMPTVEICVKHLEAIAH